MTIDERPVRAAPTIAFVLGVTGQNMLWAVLGGFLAAVAASELDRGGFGRPLTVKPGRFECSSCDLRELPTRRRLRFTVDGEDLDLASG